MTPKTRQNDNYGLPFDSLRKAIVRIYWLGLAVALVALVWPTPLLQRWYMLPLIASAGVVAGIAGPWLLDRFRHSRLYLAVLAVGAAGLSLVIQQTGGTLSPFRHFYLVMMALVAALFPPRRALLGLVLIGLGALMPAVLEYHPEHLREASASLLFYAFVAQFVSATASRLTQERRQKDHLERLAEVSRTATSLDLNATLQGTAENLVAATDADSGFIFLMQEDRIKPRVIVLSPSVYTEREFEAINQFSLRPGEGLVGWVAEHGEPILSGDSSRDSRAVQVPGTPATPESALVVPIKLDGKVIGVILLSRQGLDHFDEEDLNLVQIMADQTAVSVENGRLYEEAKNRAARLFTLSEVTRAAQSSLDPDTLLSRVEVELARFFHFDRFAIGVLDATGEAYQMIYEGGSHTAPGSPTRPSSSLKGSILEWMIRENRPNWSEDLVRGTRFYEDELLLQGGLRAVMRAPLWAEDRVIGLCSMSSETAGAFSREDAELFADIARVIGLALHHARLHQELKERAAQIEVMSQVALAANASLNLPSVVRALDQELRRILPFERLDVLLVEEDGKTYRRVAEEPQPAVPIAGSAMAWLAEHRQPLVEADLKREARFAEGAVALAAGLRSCLMVPMEAAGQLVGALAFHHAMPGVYGEHQMDVAVQVGRQAAMAVNNARLFAEMERLAITDPLTGLFNRRFFHSAWEEVSRQAHDAASPLSVLMIDVNNFKGYNDRYGHLAGDRLLKETAQILQQQVRGTDVVARYGGDEFVVLMPDTTEEQARRVKERIERAVATRNTLRSGEGGPLALDIGIESGSGAALERLLAKADAAMYQAKESSDRRQLRAVVEASEQERQRLAVQTVLSLAKIEEMKDAYTRGHSERLRDLAVEVGKALGLPEQELQNIAYGAMLHDIGKVAIPSEILHKPGALTPQEKRIMRMHPIFGEAIVADVELLQGARPIIRHHQERYDGRTSGDRPGYPDGLRGEEIPLGARIIAVVDAYDAMTTDRPYRARMTSDEALAELRANAGTQFDPNVVRVFEEVLRSRRPS